MHFHCSYPGRPVIWGMDLSRIAKKTQKQVCRTSFVFDFYQFSVESKTYFFGNGPDCVADPFGNVLLAGSLNGPRKRKRTNF